LTRRHARDHTGPRNIVLATAVLAAATVLGAGVSMGTSALAGSTPASDDVQATPDVLTSDDKKGHASEQTRYAATVQARGAAERARKAAEEAARKAAEEAARKAAEEQARKDAEAKAAAKAEAERAAAADRAARAADRAVADPKSVARAMLAEYGWSDGQFSCLDSLWTRESNWSYRAENPSSGAYGIPQALPGDKMASAGSDWRTNPATQIEWGLGYISDVYGTPCGAWEHSQSVGWY
jgi:hypothetical protein